MSWVLYTLGSIILNEKGGYMIKRVLLLGSVFLWFLVVANASAVTIDDPSDLFNSITSNIGDFAAVAGFDGKSSPGSVNLIFDSLARI